jgi:hypothetical protein
MSGIYSILKMFYKRLPYKPQFQSYYRVLSPYDQVKDDWIFNR